MQETAASVFPKKLTIFSIFVVLVLLGYGVFSQFTTSRLINSFRTKDIPTLQLSCAASRVMSETETLLANPAINKEGIEIRTQVLDDSLHELLVLTGDFPQVSDKFKHSQSYVDFKKSVDSDFSIDQKENLSELKMDMQNLIEEYLLKKNEEIRNRIFFGYISGLVILLGIVLFFILIYAVYRRYQQNLNRLRDLSEDLERERLVSIQSSKLASLGEMAAGLAHEINNPLAVIVGRAEMILEQIKTGSASNADVVKSIEKMKDMAHRISKIVISMRKISKGSSQNELTVLNLYQVIEDILNLSAERLRASAISLDLENFDKDVLVRSNFTYLTQVIINLLNNAIDELLKLDEDNRKIWLVTEDTKDFLLLKIVDNGTGVSENIKDKLFQPFFTTKEVGKGTGLGLSISKGLMKEMDGDLYLEETEKGTSFVVKIKKIL